MRITSNKHFHQLFFKIFVDLQYRVTLDSLRQISRSFFSGTQERKVQRNITVRKSECTKHSFYMLASKSYIVAALFQIKNIVEMSYFKSIEFLLFYFKMHLRCHKGNFILFVHFYHKIASLIFSFPDICKTISSLPCLRCDIHIVWNGRKKTQCSSGQETLLVSSFISFIHLFLQLENTEFLWALSVSCG